MFSLNDNVIEISTGIKGVIVDLDTSIDKPYGVLFNDDADGVWWCDKKMIKKTKEN